MEILEYKFKDRHYQVEFENLGELDRALEVIRKTIEYRLKTGNKEMPMEELWKND